MLDNSTGLTIEDHAFDIFALSDVNKFLTDKRFLIGTYNYTFNIFIKASKILIHIFL